ncbi:MAG: hypothetical protein ACYC9Y_04690 [Candidatus Methylomirabilia bacterium]
MTFWEWPAVIGSRASVEATSAWMMDWNCWTRVSMRRVLYMQMPICGAQAYAAGDPGDPGERRPPRHDVPAAIPTAEHALRVVDPRQIVVEMTRDGFKVAHAVLALERLLADPWARRDDDLDARRADLAGRGGGGAGELAREARIAWAPPANTLCRENPEQPMSVDIQRRGRGTRCSAQASRPPFRL